MSDLERRLTAALHETFDDAMPPTGLMDLVLRRHHRYRIRRNMAGAAATAIAVVLPIAIPALHHTPAPPVAANNRPPARVRPATAQPGTILESCRDQISGGDYGPGWPAHSVHAGPLWFVNVRPMAYASRDYSSPQPFGTLPVNMPDGTYAWVRVAGPSRRTFRFLYGDAGTGGSYTLRDGQEGITFAACRPGQDQGAYPGITQFWGGFVVAKVPECVTLDVWTRPSSRPIRVTLAIGPAHCRPSPLTIARSPRTEHPF